MPSKSAAAQKSLTHSSRPTSSRGSRYDATHFGLILTIVFATMGGTWCLSQSSEKLNAVSANIADVKTGERLRAEAQDATANQVRDVVLRVRGIETTVALESPAAATTAIRRDVVTGVAGIIDPSFSGGATYCPGDHRYDPTLKALAVAVGLGSNGILPCGAHVRITRLRPDGTALSIETEVVDQFPDASDDLSASNARKFNLSTSAAQSPEIDGVAVVTVELLGAPK